MNTKLSRLNTHTCPHAVTHTPCENLFQLNEHGVTTLTNPDSFTLDFRLLHRNKKPG